MSLAQHYHPNRTPQSEPISGTDENNAGGYVFALDDWQRLDSFLILGSEGGTYYVSEQKLTRENARVLERCLAADALRTVDAIVAIDTQGRAPKKGPILFALAVALASNDVKARQAAYAAVEKVARTGADILVLVSLISRWRGWSRGLRRAIGSWYGDRDVGNLGYQLVKYRERGDKAARGETTKWTHRDVLRMAHPLIDASAPDAVARQATLRWATGRAVEQADVLPLAIVGYEAAKVAGSAKETARLVREFDIPREALDTAYLNAVEVWRALLESMPLNAMVRNLGKMTSVGAVKPLSREVDKIVGLLGDAERIRKARLHPLALLLALKAYASGGLSRSFERTDGRAATTWDPVTQVVSALDDAFYLAFQAVEATGLRFYLGIDVSGSMTSNVIAKTNVTAREAASAMAMVTARVETKVYMAGFASSEGRRFGGGTTMKALDITPGMRLDAVAAKMDSMGFGATDCALPMIDALERGIEVDAFLVYTDSETWAGNVHPVQALRDYRRKTGIPAKLVVVGMTSNGFSIADPSDAGMLDVVGFDASAPALINGFIRR